MNASQINEETFEQMTLLQIIVFVLKAENVHNVIKEKFSSVWPETSISLSIDGNNLELDVVHLRAECNLTFEKRGLDVVVKLASFSRTRELTFRDASINNRVCIVLEAILQGTQIDSIDFKRYNSEKISLDEIAALPSMRNLDFLCLDFDKLTNDEAHLLLNDFPHPRGLLQIKIAEEPQPSCFHTGSIATQILQILGGCCFMTIHSLMNSPVSHISLLEKKVHHLEIKLYLYAWQCGDNNSLKRWHSKIDDDFDFMQPVIGVSTISLEKAKQLSGRFTNEDSVEFDALNCSKKIKGDNGFHLTRSDGKIASVFEYREYRGRNAFLIVVWDDENPRKRTS